MDAPGWPGDPEVVRGGSRKHRKREASRRGSGGFSQCAAARAFTLFSKFAKLIFLRRFLLCSCWGQPQSRFIAAEGKGFALDKRRIPVINERFRQDNRSRTYTQQRNRSTTKPNQY